MTAELSAAMPEDGGFVVWVERAFGRFWGFQEGWLSWLYSFFDNALYPVMFVDYLAHFTGPLAPAARWGIGVAFILLTVAANTRGVALVGRSSILLAILVLLPFAVLVLAGARHVDARVWLVRSHSVDWALLLSVVLWNTCGWDNAGCCAGEVASPSRTYPRAMIGTVVLVTAAYLLPVAVGVGVDSNWHLWKEGRFPVVAEAIGGPALANWLGVAGLVAAFGAFNALLLTSSRVPYAMAAKKMFPPALAKLHPRYGTPWVSILLNAGGVAVLLLFSFRDLVQLDMFLYSAALVLEFCALVWLRIRRPEMPRPYRVPGGTIGAVLVSLPAIAFAVVLMALATRLTQMVSLAAAAAGVVAYAIFAREKPGMPTAISR